MTVRMSGSTRSGATGAVCSIRLVGWLSLEMLVTAFPHAGISTVRYYCGWLLTVRSSSIRRSPLGVEDQKSPIPPFTVFV